MADETLVIISADSLADWGKSHGENHYKEIEIPFILGEKSVKKNHVLKYPYTNTIMQPTWHCFGNKNTYAWIGKL